MQIWSALWRINVLFRRKTGLQIFSKQRPTEVRPPYPQLLPNHSGAAISHENIQSPLRLFRISKISGFQHLAIVPYHLIDIDRIVLALVGTVVIDTTDILVLVG